MGKRDYTIGSSTIEDFFGWINERNRIWVRRNNGEPKPWTEDPIFQRWKFTNAYRQLDRGTVALQKLLERASDAATPDRIAFTIWWYRLFNLDDHALHFTRRGYLPSFPELQAYILDCYEHNRQIFTSAHMTTGVTGQLKHQTYLFSAKQAWRHKDALVRECGKNSLQHVHEWLQQFSMVGGFVAYEIVCDLRFYLMQKAEDKMTWANIGPGAKRGMERLGLDVSVETMVDLLELAPRYLEVCPEIECQWPFELREIEHCLCEFDKYERIRLDEGRPRSRFHGTDDE